MAFRQAQQLSVLLSSEPPLDYIPAGGLAYEGSQKCRLYQSDYGHHIALGLKRKRLCGENEEIYAEAKQLLQETISPWNQDSERLPGEQPPSLHSAANVTPSAANQYQPPSIIHSNTPPPEANRPGRAPLQKTVTSHSRQEIIRPVGMFGVLFPNRSFPMDASKFFQVDPLHWILDMNAFVGEGYEEVKEMCIFLLNEFSLPADKALAVYVQAPGSAFEYRGAVFASCPSAVLPLLWPKRGGDGQMQLTGADCPPLTAKIGVSVEDAASLPVVNVGQQSRIEEMALKVGENLFNFMQSFCSVESNKLVVPLDILDRWFKKFQDRAKRDPDYLNRFRL